MENEPLKKLLVKTEDLNKELLTKTLQPLLQIEEKTGRIQWTEIGNKLDIKKKIIASLLAKKASLILGLIEKETIDYKELARMISAKQVSVASQLTTLGKEYIVLKDSKEYFIPLEAVTKAIQLLKINE